MPVGTSGCTYAFVFRGQNPLYLWIGGLAVHPPPTGLGAAGGGFKKMRKMGSPLMGFWGGRGSARPTEGPGNAWERVAHTSIAAPGATLGGQRNDWDEQALLSLTTGP